MKYFVSLLIFGVSAATQASETAHGSGSIPTQQILYQAINVFIIFVALAYFLKDGIKNFFSEKKELYLSAANKAEVARKTAEQEHLQIQERLSKLQNTAEESLSRAQAEAADLKKQLIADAEALSVRIRKEAEQTAQLEIERAKVVLRQALIAEAMTAAKNQFSSKVSSEDQARLQSDFVNNLQAVQK